MGNFPLGEAVLGTAMDLLGLRKGMQEAEGESKTLWGRIGGIAENALGFLTGNVLMKGFDAVVNVARDIGTTMLTEAPRIEQLRTSFENLAASAGQSADEVLESMRAASNGMVTDASLMESYNSAMLLVGESMADKFPALLQIAQASAAATGQDVGFLLDSLVKGIGRGSPMILDNLGLTINLAAANAEYAKSLGITVDEMTKAQQQEALLNAVVDAGGEFVERLGDNTGGTAATMAQLKTTFENLKMDLAVGLLPALQAILEPLGALAREYGPQIAEFGQTVGAWLGENLPGAIATLQEIFNRVFVNEGPAALATLRGVFEEVWPWIQSLVGTVVTWFQENLPLIQQTGQTLADFFSNHIAPALDNAWTIIKTVVEIAINAVLGIIKLGMELINGDWDAAWTTFKDSVGEIWEGIKTVLSEFLEGILNAIGTNTDEFVATWRGNWEKLKEIVSGVLDGVKNFVQNFSLVEVGSNLIAGFIDGIKSAASAVADAVGNVIQGGIDAAKNLLLMDSPSKVFEEMGQFSGEGYEIGLRESSAGVAVAGTSMATQALQGASAAGSGFTMGGFNVQIGEVHIHDDRDVDDLVEQISARLGAALEGRLRPLRGAV